MTNQSRLEEAVERITGVLQEQDKPFPFHDDDINKEGLESQLSKYSSWQNSFRRLPIQGQIVLMQTILNVEIKNFTYVTQEDQNSNEDYNNLFHQFLDVVVNNEPVAPNTDNQTRRKSNFKNKSKTKQRGSGQELSPYNVETIILYQNLWKKVSSRRGIVSAMTSFILSILNSHIFIDITNKISIDLGFSITLEEAKEHDLLGYGGFDFVITSVLDSNGGCLVINVQQSNPEKEGIGHLITQMITLSKFKTFTHFLGICTDGEKFIFVDNPSGNKFEYMEKRDFKDCILTLRKWLYKIATNTIMEDQ